MLYSKSFYTRKGLVNKEKETAHPSHNGQSISTEKLRITNFLINDAVKYFFLVISWEWRLNTRTQKYKILEIRYTMT